MPNDISSISIRISGNNTELIAAVAGANAALGRLSDGVRKNGDAYDSSLSKLQRYVGRVAAAYAVFEGGRFALNQVIDSVKLAADAEKAEVAFTVMLGSAEKAKTLISDLYTFVEKTPFRLDDVRDSARILVAFGYTAGEVLPALKSLGDISAGVGIPLTEITTLLGKARIEGRQYTRDLRQFATAGIPIYEELAKAFGVATSQINILAEAGQVGARDVEQAIARLTAPGAQFGDLMAETAETLDGVYSNLLDEVDAVKRSYGEKLIPALQDVLVLLRAINEEIGDSPEGELETQAQGWVQNVVTAKKYYDILDDITTVTGGGLKSLTNLPRLFYEPMKLAEESGEAAMRLYDRLTGGGFNETAAEQIERLRKAQEASNTTSQTGIEQSATYNAKVTQAAKAAGTELDKLNKKYTRVGQSIQNEIATPMEKFEKRVQDLMQANLSGALSDSLLQRGLENAASDLNDEVNKLKNTLNDKVDFTEVGSTAAFEARLNSIYASRRNDATPDMTASIDAIRARVQAERDQLRQTIDAGIGTLTPDLDGFKSRIAELQDAVFQAHANFDLGLATWRETNDEIDKAVKAYREIEKLAGVIQGELAAIDENFDRSLPPLLGTDPVSPRNQNLRGRAIQVPNMAPLIFDGRGSGPMLNDGAFNAPLDALSTSLVAALQSEGRMSREIDKRVATAVEKLARREPIVVEEGFA